MSQGCLVLLPYWFDVLLSPKSVDKYRILQLSSLIIVIRAEL
jgi:hypothetical protein